MTFWKTVGAYLTGWVIAQSFFNRVWKRAMSSQGSKDWEKFHGELAARLAPLLADELDRMRTGEGYRPSDEGLALLAERTMGHLVGMHSSASDISREELKAAMASACQDVLDQAAGRA